MLVKDWALTIFVGSLLLSALLYYQTTDYVLQQYIPRSCEGASLNLARKSCGDYPNQLSYAENTLQFSFPLTVISGVVYVIFALKEVMKD